MIFDRLAIIFRALMTAPDRAARAMIRRTVSRRARRWGRAAAEQPALAADLLAMGRVLEQAPRTPDDTLAASTEEMAYELGRRDLALELLALMHVTTFELHQMMQETEHEHDHDDRGPLA
jgi:hypothetical protein